MPAPTKDANPTATPAQTARGKFNDESTADDPEGHHSRQTSSPTGRAHAAVRSASSRAPRREREFPEMWCDAMRRIGCYQARKQGVTLDECEDCGMAFLLHLMESKSERLILNLDAAGFSPWAHRCGANFAHNYRDHQSRHRAHVVLLQDLHMDDPEEESTPDESDLAGFYFSLGNSAASPFHDKDPLQQTLQGEFWQLLHSLLSKLEAGQQVVLLACVVEGENSAEVAVALERSPNAIRLMLTRTRKQIRSHLKRRGIEESDLREYLMRT